MQSLPACGSVGLKGKLMPVSIYAVSYERNSAAFYEAFESSFYKDVCNLLYAYFGEDKGERERDRCSSVP